MTHFDHTPKIYAESETQTETIKLGNSRKLIFIEREQEFIKMCEKMNRSENQRSERRAKR